MALLLALMLTAATEVASAQASSGAHSASRAITGERQAEELPAKVRIAVSPSANSRLLKHRLRRLVAIELAGIATLESSATGSLGPEVIRVWIDVPEPRRAVIEVRRTGRRLARRALAIGSFPADVAARVVAIATSQMVRVQARAQPEPLCEKIPEGPRENEGKLGDFAVSAGISSQLLFGNTPTFVAGPELSVEHRRFISAQLLYARWLIGEEDDHRMRWLELGGGIDFRIALPHPDWRLSLGGRAGGVAMFLPDVGKNDSTGPKTSDWTVHATARVAIEVALTPRSWLALAAEPGGLLRSLTISDRDGEHTNISGATVGFSLSLLADPLRPRGSQQTR